MIREWTVVLIKNLTEGFLIIKGDDEIRKKISDLKVIDFEE